MNFFRHRISRIFIPCLVAIVLLIPEIAFADVGLWAQNIVWKLVVNITGLAVNLGGVILDSGINTFVIGFGDLYRNSGLGVAVNNVWIILRDFINLGFIFGLVYIGFQMILGGSNSNTRRWLINLIIAAIFINFSLLATKFVIDFTNEIAAQIAIQGLGGESYTEIINGQSVTKYKVDTSAMLLNKMGASTIFSEGKTEDLRASENGWGYIFGTGIMFLVAGFVFAAGGIILIIRFVVLHLFMVLSPLMFIGWVLPVLGDKMSEYWKQFLSRAFVAPVYLLLLYLSIQIIDGLQTAGKFSPAGINFNKSLAGGAEVLESADSTIPFFILICGFLIASIVVAQKMGADGAAQAVSLGKNLSNRAQRGLKNIGTQTAGRGARWASNKAGSATESTLRRAQQLQGDGRFARATRAVARMNAVQGTVGGAATAMQGAKFGLSSTVEEDKKMRNQTEKRSENAMTISRGLSANELNGRTWASLSADEQKKYAHLYDQNLRGANNNLIPPDEQIANHIAKMQREAAEMSVKDFEAMSEDQQEKIAEFLSGSQTDAVMKSDNISDEQKGKIENAQKAAIEKIIDSNGEIITEKITNLSIRQIETMGDDFINKHAAHFTDSQMSELKKSKKFTESQVGRFVGKRKTDLLAMVNNPATAAQAFEQTTGRNAAGQMQTKARKTAEIAKLPGDVLADGNSVKFLTVDVLKAITNNDKGFEQVSMQQREDIYNQLQLQSLTQGALNQNAIKALNYIRSTKGQEEFLGK